MKEGDEKHPNNLNQVNPTQELKEARRKLRKSTEAQRRDRSQNFEFPTLAEEIVRDCFVDIGSRINAKPNTRTLETSESRIESHKEDQRIKNRECQTGTENTRFVNDKSSSQEPSTSQSSKDKFNQPQDTAIASTSKLDEHNTNPQETAKAFKPTKSPHSEEESDGLDNTLIPEEVIQTTISSNTYSSLEEESLNNKTIEAAGQLSILFHSELMDSTLQRPNTSMDGESEAGSQAAREVSQIKFIGVEPFSGEDEHHDVNEFLQIYEYYGRSYRLSDDKLIENFIDYLRGKARLWYISLRNEGSKIKVFEDIRKEMTERFAPMGEKNKARVELMNRFQRENEHAGTFVNDIIRLCKKVEPGMSDENKMYQIKTKLLPAYQKKLAAHKIESPSELMSHLVAIEDNFAVMPLAKEKEPAVSRRVAFNDDNQPGNDDQIKRVVQQVIAEMRPRQPNFQQNKFASPQPMYQPQYNNYQLKTSSRYQGAPQYYQGVNQRPSNQQPAYNQSSNQMVYQQPQAFQNYQQRRARTPDGQPICDFCREVGHIMRNCYHYARGRNRQQNWQGGQQSPRPNQIDARGETNPNQGKE